MDNVIVSTGLILSTIAVVLPAALAIRKNSNESMRFEFTFQVYSAFAIGIVPVLWLIYVSDFDRYFWPSFGAIVYGLAIVTAAVGWMQTRIQREEHSGETQFWMLLGGAACGYVWIFVSMAVSLLAAMPYMDNSK